MTTTIKITSFEPYAFELPEVESLTGLVLIELPPVFITVFDFGPLFDNMKIGADSNVLHVNVDFHDNVIELSKFVDFLIKQKHNLCAIHQAHQDEMNKRPLNKF